jgi:hypothetical protein
MPSPKCAIPKSAELIPPPQELRLRLAVALREVDLLRRLIRLAEDASRIQGLEEPIGSRAERPLSEVKR